MDSPSKEPLDNFLASLFGRLRKSLRKSLTLVGYLTGFRSILLLLRNSESEVFRVCPQTLSEQIEEQIENLAINFNDFPVKKKDLEIAG